MTIISTLSVVIIVISTGLDNVDKDIPWKDFPCLASIKHFQSKDF